MSEPPPDSGIATGSLYTEFAACIECGLDLEKWLEGGYSKELMAHAVAFYRLKHAVEAHSNDAALAKAKQRVRH